MVSGSMKPKASLSDRLKGMNFMKRREERAARAGLAAAEEASANAEQWVAVSASGEDASDGSNIVVVVEGGGGGAAGGAVAGAANVPRAGRRSFGSFNVAVEKGFAESVLRARGELHEIRDEKVSALEADAAAQYQTWKAANVSDGAGTVDVGQLAARVDGFRTNVRSGSSGGGSAEAVRSLLNGAIEKKRRTKKNVRQEKKEWKQASMEAGSEEEGEVVEEDVIYVGSGMQDGAEGEAKRRRALTGKVGKLPFRKPAL